MKITRYLIKINVFASKQGESISYPIMETTYESDSATIFRIPQSKLFADDVEINMTFEVIAIRNYKESNLNKGMIELEKEIKLKD